MFLVVMPESVPLLTLLLPVPLGRIVLFRVMLQEPVLLYCPCSQALIPAV